MKTLFPFAAYLTILMFASCVSTGEQKPEKDFKADLIDLSNQKFDFFTTNDTRNANTVKEFNADVLDQMLDIAANLSAKYDLYKQTQASGYYAKMDKYVNNFTIEQSQKLISENSTTAFNILITNLAVYGEIVDNNEIIDNTNLLPIEQIALIMVNNFAKSNARYAWPAATRSNPNSDDSANECSRAYDEAMRKCNYSLLVGFGITVVVGVGSGGLLATLAGGATVIDYANCTGDAQSAFNYCIEAKYAQDDSDMPESEPESEPEGEPNVTPGDIPEDTSECPPDGGPEE